MLVGWGIFNHVREGARHQTAYDFGFLALSVLLIVGGWLVARLGERKYRQYLSDANHRP
jgi:uncharacterized membrane protein